MTPIFILLGTTGSGKTAVSLPLAEALAAEIVCLDSRQVFRGMAIGTAQPTAEEQARVPHHLFGVIAPGERFSAGDYGRLARRTLGEIEARGGRALFVGGAGLYLKGLIGGLAETLPHDEEKRRLLRKRAGEEESEVLHRELEQLDPKTAARFHPRDAQRITRALEIIAVTGKKVSDLIAAGSADAGNASAADVGGADAGSSVAVAAGSAADPGSLASRLRIVVLDRDRDDIYARIEARTEVLLASGMIEEARTLLENGLSPEWPVYKAHGYPEIAAWLAGRLDRKTLSARLSQVTRNYAKRQLTWFRRLEGAVWLPVPRNEASEVTATRAVAALNR